MNCSFRLSNSAVRFSDSLAVSLVRAGRSTFASFKSFNLLAMGSSVAKCYEKANGQIDEFTRLLSQAVLLCLKALRPSALDH